jgi:hypothetical protein
LAAGESYRRDLLPIYGEIAAPANSALPVNVRIIPRRQS